jgi:hypothetical protein
VVNDSTSTTTTTRQAPASTRGARPAPFEARVEAGLVEDGHNRTVAKQPGCAEVASVALAGRLVGVLGCRIAGDAMHG